MHGLVSLLPQPYYQQVEQLWQELEDQYGLRGIRVTPYPHFSWQIADDYQFDRLEGVLAHFSKNTIPFPVQTAGLGLFTGDRPVIFIPVVKTEALMDFHARLWERTQPTSRSLSPLYAPEAWVPHISLAYQDVTPANIASVMQTLAFLPFTWQMDVDNLALIYEPSGSIGTLKYHFKFDL